MMEFVDRDRPPTQLVAQCEREPLAHWLWRPFREDAAVFSKSWQHDNMIRSAQPSERWTELYKRHEDPCPRMKLDQRHEDLCPRTFKDTPNTPELHAGQCTLDPE